MKKKPVSKIRLKKSQKKQLKLISFFVLGLSFIVTAVLVYSLTNTTSRDSQFDAYAAGNRWESGASCMGVADGSFATWRGSPVTIAGTWNDSSLASQKEQWSIGGEYPMWTESIDNAIGAFWNSSWDAAARGDHDANLRTALQNIDKGWGTKKTIYIRYGHEFNGSWFQWKVTSSNNESFKKAFARFYNLVQTELVAKGRDAKVVWSPNSGEHNGINTELNWPGDQYVDVVGVDYYDWDVLNTQAKWDAAFYKKGASGGPYGIGAWQEFARKHGKPLAFPEWGTSSEKPTENPFFIQKMNEFMTANAGTGPGQIAYDVYFNCTGYGGSGGEKFQIYPTTILPQTAAMYKSLKWGSSIIDTATPTLGALTPTSTPPVVTATPTATPTPTGIIVPTATPTIIPATPISFRSSTTGTNGSSSRSLTLTKPANVMVSDIMVAHIAVNTASTKITAPSGWTFIRSDQTSGSLKMATYYRIVTASDPASYVWSFNTSQAATGGISAFSGVNTTNPIQATSGKYNDSVATVSFNQVTTTVPNGLILALVSVSGNTSVTQPSGFSEIYDRNNTSSSNGKTVEVSMQLKSTIGLTSVPNGREDTLSKSNLAQLIVLRAK